MATTSIHLSPELLAQLDEAARKRGTSRNKFIVEACEAQLTREKRGWPPGFLDGSHLTEQDRALLAEAREAFTTSIYEARRSKREAPF